MMTHYSSAFLFDDVRVEPVTFKAFKAGARVFRAKAEAEYKQFDEALPLLPANLGLA